MGNRFVTLSVVSGLLFASINTRVSAKEGMWRPADLKKQEKELKAAGLKIPISQIYNDGATAMNDAVVLFGAGCTGEVVSSQGLIFTNHHCGYGAVQGVSTPEKNYLVHGFWAKNNAEEIPCPGLSVTFVRKIENVTKAVLKGVTDDMSEAQRKATIENNIKFLSIGLKKQYQLDINVKPYYNGNEYWATIQEKFDDVRLVGFPPNGIGKFGGDTDNWMWPRHTGDFGVFRIYADANNKPAKYSASNRPYKPKTFLPINTSGVKEGDFTMVYGFPFATRSYLTESQLAQTQDIIDPIRINARRIKLGVWDSAMRLNSNTFLKYAAKQSSVSNGYKKWQGEIRGLEINDVKAKKAAYETLLMQKSNEDTSASKPNLIISQIDAAVEANNRYLRAQESINETVLGIELIQQAAQLDKVLKIHRSKVTGQKLIDTLKPIKASLSSFYKNYDVQLDKKFFQQIMPFYLMQPDLAVPPEVRKMYAFNNQDYERWANNVYANSQLSIEGLAAHYFTNPKPSDTLEIKQDEAWRLYQAVTDWQNQKIKPQMTAFNNRMEGLSRRYMAAQLQYMQNERNFYPDANQTLRLTYGTVQGIKPQGSNLYSFITDLDGAVQKHNPKVEEFNMPLKLRQLHERRDYGRWAANGKMPIAFIASNHTSGGNSGSPVLNGKGELIGINFDRIWDGTMSDLYFDPNLSRNISVDIRYVMFIIEKYGNASWLFKEMKLVP